MLQFVYASCEFIKREIKNAEDKNQTLYKILGTWAALARIALQISIIPNTNKLKYLTFFEGIPPYSFKQ